MIDKCPHGEFRGLCHACSEALIYALKHKLELAEKVVDAARSLVAGKQFVWHGSDVDGRHAVDCISCSDLSDALQAYEAANDFTV